ncbi:ester cyclase [Cohnella zeiphila]|uniref:Ester cyclase n=1 Tax=Cohnella zeiphila TaxID=2761120 RepID=A0A7X0VXR7_9BACL|nr:ester cyclase [Cohnella zeiphila]MBB6734589.1 ester cyclase [Cohnella zeiphila]
MKTKERQNAETVGAFIEALWNDGKLESTDQFFSGQIGEAFSDRSYELEDVFAEEDKATARIIITGTHTGTFAGHPPTGKTVRITQFREFRFLDGQTVSQRGWFDTGTLLPQLQA